PLRITEIRGEQGSDPCVLLRDRPDEEGGDRLRMHLLVTARPLEGPLEALPQRVAQLDGEQSGLERGVRSAGSARGSSEIHVTRAQRMTEHPEKRRGGGGGVRDRPPAPVRRPGPTQRPPGRGAN